ncbi:MAG: glycosyltransferase family 39 protein [Deltaproteobacteria bacterium]|nr:glycosyltransferase family 39 protein [Deltaproteobacteria bacterium]
MSTSGDSPRFRTLPLLWTAAFVAVSALLLFWGSWGGSLYNSDDYIYLDFARGMRETGDWLELRFQGVVFHQRPPLSTWLLAVSTELLGDTPFAARLPSILMGLAGLWLTVLVTRRLLRDEATALLAAGLVLATHLFYFHVRGATSDATLFAGLMAFLFFHLRFDGRWRDALGLGLALGWMLMTKGVVAVLPAALAMVHWMARRRWDLLRSPRLPAALVLALALALPWHLAMTLRHGAAFWEEYIGFNVLARAGGSLFFEADPLYYVRRLLLHEGVLPYLYVAGLVAGVLRLQRRRDAADLFLFLWLLVLFLPFQLSSTRLYHYLLPSVPALSVLAARTAAPILHRPWGLPAALVAALGLFLGNNLAHLDAEYSGDQRRFADAVRAEAADPAVRVFSLNRYELAFFHLTGRPVRMITTDPGGRDALLSLPEFSRTRTVEFLEHPALEVFLAEGPFVCITDPPSLPLLCGPDPASCRGGRARVVAGVRALLVVGEGPGGRGRGP